MAAVVVLGSSNAVPDENHENTHLAVAGEEEALLIDCGPNPLVRLRWAGIDAELLSDMILTHFHPDHVSALPVFLMDLWLLGRKRPLIVHGLAHTLERVETLMDLFGWSAWPNFFPVEFRRIPEQEMVPVIEKGEWRVFASPVCHLIPTIGLRIEFNQTNKVVAYSSDTGPCPPVARLSREADVLFHESTGAFRGHSSASQAGDIASQAGAKSLYLIHYPTGDFDPNRLVQAAAATFQGPVALATDYMALEF